MTHLLRAELWPAPIDSSSRVREMRHSMFCQSTMWIETEATEVTLRIRNLSASGLMGESSYPLERGEAVVVSLRNIGERRARVVWTEGRRFGLKFARPIDPKSVRQPVGLKLLDATLLPPVRDHSRPAMRRGF